MMGVDMADMSRYMDMVSWFYFSADDTLVPA
jgi:hypothetical protein